MNQLTKNRFKIIVTSYARNKNLDDGIKKIAERIPEATRSVGNSPAKQ